MREDGIWWIMRLMIIVAYGLKYFDKKASPFGKAAAWLEFLTATILISIIQNI